MKIKTIDFGTDKLPTRMHYNDAGADVYVNSIFDIEPGETVKIPLGFGLEIPDGFVGFIFPRSSLSAKGIVCQLPPIDSGYRGEVHAIISNLSADTFYLEEDLRIGQLVIMPCVLAEFVTSLPEIRGANAFGSTGA